MKIIGLIGGMSWESTVSYYQMINKMIQQNLGGFHSGKILLYSVDFHDIEQCQATGDWTKSGEILLHAAKSLEKAGADFILICTNTMHKVIPQIQQEIQIPFIHIAESTALQLKHAGIIKVALLGTKYTMTQDFYKNKLEQSGITVIIPNENDIETVNNIIYQELCLGKITESSKQAYLDIIQKMEVQGAQGVILGCTEIGMLIHQSDVSLPVFDTTLIHAEAAVTLALSDEA